MRFFYDVHFVISGWNKKSLAEDQINLWECRGRKITFDKTNKKRIVMLGDSQVVASKSSIEQMPEALLEEAMNGTSVCSSIASGGWGQDQQYLSLKSFFENNNKVDLVTLWFTPFNDVWNNMFPTHYPKNGWAKPTYWLENDTLKGPTEEIGELVYATPRIRILEPIKLILNRPFIFDRDGFFEKKFFTTNECWLKVKPTSVKVNPFKSRLNALNIKEKQNFLNEENFVNGKNHWSLWMKPASQRMEYGIDLTNRLLKLIAGLCEENNAQFFVFWVDIVPGLNDFPSRRIQEPHEYVSYKNKVYLLSNSQYRENMQKIIKGVPNEKIILKMESWWRDQKDSHFNLDANKRIMNDLAQIINNIL